MAETSVATAIVDTPLVGNYTVTATVSVTQGPWNGGGVTHFLDPVSKTFLADSKWEFSLNLVDQEWKLT
jgi:hypothetical protein